MKMNTMYRVGREYGHPLENGLDKRRDSGRENRKILTLPVSRKKEIRPSGETPDFGSRFEDLLVKEFQGQKLSEPAANLTAGAVAPETEEDRVISRLHEFWA